MIRVRHYKSRDRYEYFMYRQFFPSSHYPTDFSSLPIFSIYFAYLFDRQNRIISRLILHAILLASSWSNNYTAACKREIETIIENFPVDRSMLVMALRNFSRFQGPIFYRTKKDHPFFLISSQDATQAYVIQRINRAAQIKEPPSLVIRAAFLWNNHTFVHYSTVYIRNALFNTCLLGRNCGCTNYSTVQRATTMDALR